MKTFFHWIGLQVEWMKSIWSEPKTAGSELQGSSTRILKLFVILAFIIPYWKVSLASQRLEDMPTGWLIMIGLVLGFNVADLMAKFYINKAINGKTNGTDKQAT